MKKKENNNEEKDESVFRNPIVFIGHAKYGNDGLPNYDEDKIKGKTTMNTNIYTEISGSGSSYWDNTGDTKDLQNGVNNPKRDNRK